MTVGAAKVASSLAERKLTENIVSGIETIRTDLKPFSSDVKDLKIDYMARTARLHVLVSAPIGVRRHLNTIRVPTAGFQFKEIRNSSYDPVPGVLVSEGGQLTCRASALPDNDEKFFFIFERQLAPEALDNLVDVSSSVAPADDDGRDIYWLSSALRSPELLEKLYTSVEIDKVDVSVMVVLQRYFFTSLPDTLGRILRARDELYRGAQTGNRSVSRRAEYTIRKTAKKTLVTDQTLMDLIGDLISQETLSSHVKASDPFQVVKIDPDERRVSLIPERFAVHAGTSLNYRQRVARGSISFSREAYKTAVRERMTKMFPGLSPSKEQSSSPETVK